MRIGIDLLACQGPSRYRGIGRMTRHLVSELLMRYDCAEFVLYSHSVYPDSNDRWPGRPIIRQLQSAAPAQPLHQVIQWLATTNPDGLDVLLLPSAFELEQDYRPPVPDSRLPVACVLHDLIPLNFQENYLGDTRVRGMYRAALENLQRCDLLLVDSEATRGDALHLLAMPQARVVTIGAAADANIFFPDFRRPAPAGVDRFLASLGITNPFVFCLGGLDERKNLQGLIQAFALLPKRLLSPRQLVITCELTPDSRAKVCGWAESCGVADRLVLTNFVDDESLRILYQRCAAFAFPSRAEGFGLPILEAMSCGAAVLAGNNSSQPEVVGDAGVLVNVDEPTDVAEKLARLLDDDTLAEQLRGRAIERAAAYSWQATADRAFAALERTVHRRSRRRFRRLPAKPRIAFFSPLPPLRSGISDYSQRLLAVLRKHYTIDLYHDSGYIPEPSLSSQGFACYDHRMFPLYDRAVNYHQVVYQMGNSEYHGFVYHSSLRHPGLLVLHDLNLAGFHFWYSGRAQAASDFLVRELSYDSPEYTARFLAEHESWALEPGGLVGACRSRGINFTCRLLERSQGVIVHSPWNARRIMSGYPDMAARLRVIPHGATANEATPREREAIRRRLGIAPETLLFTSLGIIDRTKCNVEAINAFASVALRYPSAQFLFAGRDFGQGETAERVSALGLGARVRFLGHVSMQTFLDVAAVADVGVNLRSAPTNGETSGSLLTMLAAGVATVVTDVDTFSEYPDEVVWKIGKHAMGTAGLEQALLGLAADPQKRQRLGAAAQEYIRRIHSWPRVAQLYAEAIEGAHAEYLRLARFRSHKRLLDKGAAA